MNDIELANYRIKRLEDAIDRVSQGNRSDFGRKLGFRDGAFIRQMLAGTRPITEKTVRLIESLHGMSGWFDVLNDSTDTVTLKTINQTQGRGSAVWPLKKSSIERIQALTPAQQRRVDEALDVILKGFEAEEK